MDTREPRTVARAVVSRRKNEHGGWHVKAYDSQGDRIPEADHFTDDKMDATETAKAMTERKTAVSSFRQAFFGCSYLQRCLNRGYYPRSIPGMHRWERIAVNMGERIQSRFQKNLD